MMFISYIDSATPTKPKELDMKFLVKFLALLAVTITVAQAACPPTMPYGCREGLNGKQVCGCGIR